MSKPVIKYAIISPNIIAKFEVVSSIPTAALKHMFKYGIYDSQEEAEQALETLNSPKIH